MFCQARTMESSREMSANNHALQSSFAGYAFVDGTTQCFTGNKKRGQITRFTAESSGIARTPYVSRFLSKCRKLTVICFDLGISIGKVVNAEP